MFAHNAAVPRSAKTAPVREAPALPRIIRPGKHPRLRELHGRGHLQLRRDRANQDAWPISECMSLG